MNTPSNTAHGDLPQGGCILQPRVAAPPLPWDTVTHVINPAGVASEGRRHATIVVSRLSASGIFPQGYLIENT